MSNKLANNKAHTVDEYFRKGGEWITYATFAKLGCMVLKEGGKNIVVRPNQKEAGVWKNINGIATEVEIIKAA